MKRRRWGWLDLAALGAVLVGISLIAAANAASVPASAATRAGMMQDSNLRLPEAG